MLRLPSCRAEVGAVDRALSGTAADTPRDDLERIHTRRVLDDEETAQALGMGGVSMRLVRRRAAPLHQGSGLSRAQSCESASAAIAQVCRQKGMMRSATECGSHAGTAASNQH